MDVAEELSDEISFQITDGCLFHFVWCHIKSLSFNNKSLSVRCMILNKSSIQSGINASGTYYESFCFLLVVFVKIVAKNIKKRQIFYCLSCSTKAPDSLSVILHNLFYILI